MPMRVDYARLISTLIASGVSAVMLYFVLKKLTEPERSRRPLSAKMKTAISRLKKKGVKLNRHEVDIAAEVLDPEELMESFDDVGGLEKTVQLLRDEVVLPFTNPNFYASASRLVQTPKGILLHGPPGCGKTLLAKALAKECECCFINVRPSIVFDKFVGESEKKAEAIFTIAQKLQPSIIFIDEIDCFLRTRATTDHETSASVKSQFMMLWDGVQNDPANKIIVVAATNRPEEVDPAILRRLPRSCYIGHPDVTQRAKILKVILRHENLAGDVDVSKLARRTDGYSGADLHELCRLAATKALRDTIGGKREQQPDDIAASSNLQQANAQHQQRGGTVAVRAMRMEDFESGRSAVEHASSEGVVVDSAWETVPVGTNGSSRTSGNRGMSASSSQSTSRPRPSKSLRGKSNRRHERGQHPATLSGGDRHSDDHSDDDDDDDGNDDDDDGEYATSPEFDGNDDHSGGPARPSSNLNDMD